MISNLRISTFKLACLTGALMAASVYLPGCGNKTTGETVASNPAPAEAAPAPAATDFPAVLKDIEACGDMFAWQKVQAAYLAGTGRDAGVDAALAAKEQELLTKSPAWPVNDALEVVAFDWKLNGSNSAEGKNESFTATWLFRTKKAMELQADDDVKLVLRGWPDKAHRHYLKEAGRKEDRYFELTYSLKPPMREWAPGSYHVVTQKTPPQLPNVPYRMHTILSQLKKKGEDWSFVGPFGELVDMGWFADLGQ